MSELPRRAPSETIDQLSGRHSQRPPGRPVRRMPVILLVAALGASGVPVGSAEPPPHSVDFFEAKIRPLLIDHCQDCHGPGEAAGKLRLDTRGGWERGGERGPAVVPGDPSASLLIHAVSYRDGRLKMPPEDAGGRLSDRQVADLIAWVRGGAHDPRSGEAIVTDIEAAAENHWAFRPVRVAEIEGPGHPIDVLIERKLRRRGFVSTEPADTRTLIRRTVYDLHGLPPTAAQLDTPRDRFPQLVQELLDSPRYGERWGRHWLDVARYSDAKDGVLMYGDARIRPFAYTYRDYVIRAFNDDKPFDRFVREQLAADQLPWPDHDPQETDGPPELAALGLLTLGRMFDRNRHDVIDDQIDVVTRGFLGLTVSCARCHDHKFDPIPTADYYSLYGVFASCVEPMRQPRIGPVTGDGAAFETELADKLREIRQQQQDHHAATLKTARERTPDYLAHVATTEPDVAETTIFFLSLTPEQLRPQITRRWRQRIARRAYPDDPIFGPWHDLMVSPRPTPQAWRQRGVDARVIDAILADRPQTPAEIARTYGNLFLDVWREQGERSDISAEDPIEMLLASRQGPVWFPPGDVASYLSRQPADAYRGLLGQRDAIAVKHPAAAPRAMTLIDSEIPHDPVIFLRGDPALPGPPVPRRFLDILSADPRSPFTRGSGRSELADAIVSPDNPLTARVWVNRVWMHHFGQPLVENPSDFGLQTERPEQHELLDLLADFFVRNGWRTKPLHRWILASRAYQRSSRVPPSDVMLSQRAADPDNALLWRAHRRRLDLEQMRDTFLAVADELDDSMFGRPLPITDPENRRRTVYAFVERQNVPEIFGTFDFANADTSTARRVHTTVPQQALFAMNSPFVIDAAQKLARRCQGETADDQIGQLFRHGYGRQPETEERQWCRDFLDTNPLEQLAQIVLMSNEMMFID